MKIREKLYDYWFIVLMASVFTFSFVLTAITYEQWFATGMVMAIVLVAGVAITGHIEFDLKLLFLFEAFLLVAVKDNINYAKYDVAFAWILVIPYLLGKLVVGKKEGSDKRLFYAYNVLGFAMAFLCLGDILYTHIRGSMWITLFYRFWNDENYSRSSAEMFFTLVQGALAYAFLYRQKKKAYFALISLLNITIFGLMIYHEGRFSLVAVFAGIIIVVAMYYIDNFSHEKMKQLLKIVGVISAMAVLVILLVKINLFGLGDIYNNSFLSRDGGLLKNVRIASTLTILSNLKNYPLGGYNELSEIGSHDMWLDYGNHYGLPVLACLVCYLLLTFIDAARLCFIKEKDFGIKYLLIPGFILLNLNYIIEGAAFSIRLYLCYGLFLAGMIRAKLEQEKQSGPVITHMAQCEGIKYVNEES
ncbi:hypothetical protein SAMN02910298_01923 [Pseudobutyrivibrio sp. YE44]|uniref:hypothetical protein n=1 Tax=Pseudobutyrivibrio sp. YE44 TaxID=1520802 RepID=UPI000880AEF1|nr:hypothetical protein [Pseudobutyrivibrio sp. YE44]SDB38979.1 hypothetical protein SAMN02910298_01923 [Pseudobutyrivibrio sp. YE44]